MYLRPDIRKRVLVVPPHLYDLRGIAKCEINIVVSIKCLGLSHLRFTLSLSILFYLRNY